MLTDTRPDWTFDLDQPGIRMTTMTEYDETFAFPVAFPPQMPANTIGEVVSEAGLTQLRIAESEKYPHVTYFLNGGREVEFPGERRGSSKVRTCRRRTTSSRRCPRRSLRTRRSGSSLKRTQT